VCPPSAGATSLRLRDMPGPPTRPDERDLMVAILEEDMSAAATKLGIHPRRLASILRKWAARGWYEAGAGRLTETGREEGQALDAERRLGGDR